MVILNKPIKASLNAYPTKLGGVFSMDPYIKSKWAKQLLIALTEALGNDADLTKLMQMISEKRDDVFFTRVVEIMNAHESTLYRKRMYQYMVSHLVMHHSAKEGEPKTTTDFSNQIPTNLYTSMSKMNLKQVLFLEAIFDNDTDSSIFIKHMSRSRGTLFGKHKRSKRISWEGAKIISEINAIRKYARRWPFFTDIQKVSW